VKTKKPKESENFPFFYLAMRWRAGAHRISHYNRSCQKSQVKRSWQIAQRLSCNFVQKVEDEKVTDWGLNYL
jgi:hypothetical protein